MTFTGQLGVQAAQPSNLQLTLAAPPLPPTVTTLAASSLTGTTATLNASVNPQGTDAQVTFQWGTSTSYANVTPAVDAGAGTSAVPIATVISGLSSQITYHYRAVATNPNGTTYGADQTFVLITTTFTNGVGASLAPWNDTAGNWQALNAALAAMFEQAYGIVSAQGSPDSPASYTAGYSTLLDPVNCPTQFLPYLSQFNGTGVPPGTDSASARSIITNEAGFSRGTPAAITAACKRFLTGTQSVGLLERTPNPYAVTIVVKPGELTSLPGLTAAVGAVKPAGITVTVVVTDQWTWNQAVNTWSADTMTWNATASQQP